MGAREAAHTYRLRKWMETIRQCRNSDKTVKAWCAEQDVNEKSFYYWQRQIREGAGQKLPACSQTSEGITASPQPVFAELDFPEEPTARVAVTIHLREAVVEIQDGASASTIENALHALKNI